MEFQQQPFPADSPRQALQPMYVGQPTYQGAPTMMQEPPVQMTIPDFLQEDIAQPVPMSLMIRDVTYYDSEIGQETTDDLSLAEVKDQLGPQRLLDVVLVVKDLAKVAPEGTNLKGATLGVEKGTIQNPFYMIQTREKGPAIRTRVYLDEFYEAHNHTELGIDLALTLRVRRPSEPGVISVEKYYCICRANPNYLGAVLRNANSALELEPHRVQRIYLER